MIKQKYISILLLISLTKAINCLGPKDFEEFTKSPKHFSYLNLSKENNLISIIKEIKDLNLGNLPQGLKNCENKISQGYSIISTEDIVTAIHESIILLEDLKKVDDQDLKQKSKELITKIEIYAKNIQQGKLTVESKDFNELFLEDSNLPNIHRSPTTIVADQSLGDLSFKGYDGSSMTSGAKINAIAENNITGGSIPTHVSISVTPNGSTLTEKVRIHSTGTLAVDGGLHIGALTDPGYQNLSVEGNTVLKGSTQITQLNSQGIIHNDSTGLLSTSLITNQDITAGTITDDRLASVVDNANTANAIVKRDANGNFAAGIITGNLAGNATTANTATNFTGALAGDVTGNQSTTHVALVGGQSAANIAAGVQLANAATDANTIGTLVKRDSIGNFSAGTITANLSGASSLNVLKTGDTMTGPLTLTGASSNLTVGGSTLFNGPVNFSNNIPGVAQRILIVTTGLIAGPNEFNSINAALNSITDNSPTNRYSIKVGPGVFIEDTIYLKPYVAITGESPLSSVIQARVNAQNIIVGCDSAIIENLYLTGATAAGFSAITMNNPGVFRANFCRFGNNYCLFKQNSTAPLTATLIEHCSIDITSTFSIGFDITDDGTHQSLVVINRFTYIVQSYINLQTFAKIYGTNTAVIADDMNITSNTPQGGAGGATGFSIYNGAKLRLEGSTLGGFSYGLDLPNTGAGPEILLSSTYETRNYVDARVLNPNAFGSINGTLAKSKIIIDPTVENISLFALDPDTLGTMTVGQQYVGNSIDSVTNINPQVQQGSTLGIIYGGNLTIGAGLTVNVASGTGYLMVGSEPNDDLKYIEWNAQASPSLQPNQDNFIYIDQTGTVQASLSLPDITQNIFIGKARTTSTGILYIQNIGITASHTATKVDNTLINALGVIYTSGSLVSKNNNTQLNISSGTYYLGAQKFNPTGGNTINWHAFYRNGSGNYTVINQNNIDYANYDDGSGSLAPIPSGKLARHALYVVGDGSSENYLLVYAQTTFDTLQEAQSGSIPPQPSTWTGNIALIASVIVENTATASNQIMEITDERPRLGFKASGISVITNHGDLSGLLNDDHPQYLKVDGTRPMTGNLNMGNSNITNVNLVDTVKVSAHASRHLPNGLDPLPIGAPITIGTINQTGVQNSFSLSDHIHAHGDQPGGTLHALASGSTHGFMSSTDKTKLDALNSANYVQKAGDTMTGNLAISSATGNPLAINTNKFTVDTLGNTIIAGNLTAAGNTALSGTLNVSGNSSLGGTLALTGQATLSTLGTGIVHSNSSGVLSSSTIVDADVSSSAAIAYSKLNLAGNIINTDVASGAAIAYSKLNLSGNIVNADISTSAAIADTKLATINTAGKVANSATTATSTNTANTIVLRDGSGNFAAGTITMQDATIVDTVAANTKVRVGNPTVLASNDGMLSVAGKVNINITDPANAGNTLNVGGRISATGFDTISDSKVKKNQKIIDSKESLNLISKLQPKTYTFDKDAVKKYNLGSGIHRGLIAQEVKEVIPSVVSGNNELLKINYLELIPDLIGAIKACNEKIEKYQKELEELKKKIK